MEKIHISLAAERLGEIWGIPITNTLITAWVVMAMLITFAFLLRRRIALIPGKLQTLVEWIITYVRDFSTETIGDKKWATRFLPLLLTLFLFIFVSNAIEFTPGIGSVGFYHEDHGETHFTPLFRSVNTDLNVTLALAIIAVVVIEVAGIVALGFFKYAGKFINFSSPTNFVVGIIELISEISRLVSFSFRLFGNIFAGEVLIAVIVFFVPYVLPVPMMAFEMFIGFVQAAVFPLLVLFFLKLALAEPHGSH